MKKLILIITVAALFGSCKKEYTCECESIKRTCIQKREPITGFITNVNCVDSLVSKSIFTNSKNCKNSQELISNSLDTLTIYSINNCKID